jgi:hypothetical protein
MAKRRHGGSGCSFGDKFAQYLARERTNVTAFAKRAGLKQRTLHGWVKEGVRVPADGLAIIARETGIPAEYWANDSLPWPPATEYAEDIIPALLANLKSLPLETIREFAEIAKDRADVEMTLALRRAARRGRSP